MNPAGKTIQSYSLTYWLCLLLAVFSFAPGVAEAHAGGLPGKDQLATGRPETRLSGIETGIRPAGTRLSLGTKLSKIIKLYGPPTSKEDAVVPDGAGGTRFYIWQWPGLKMSVATYFTYRKLVHPRSWRGGMIESRVAYIDVWGDAPRGLLGTTGRGLALGCTLEQQKAIYGESYSIPYTDKNGTTYVEMQWEDGTFLTVDYGPSGRSNHIRLTTRER